MARERDEEFEVLRVKTQNDAAWYGDMLRELDRAAYQTLRMRVEGKEIVLTIFVGESKAIWVQGALAGVMLGFTEGQKAAIEDGLVAYDGQDDAQGEDLEAWQQALEEDAAELEAWRDELEAYAKQLSKRAREPHVEREARPVRDGRPGRYDGEVVVQAEPPKAPARPVGRPDAAQKPRTGKAGTVSKKRPSRGVPPPRQLEAGDRHVDHLDDGLALGRGGVRGPVGRVPGDVARMDLRGVRIQHRFEGHPPRVDCCGRSVGLVRKVTHEHHFVVGLLAAFVATKTQQLTDAGHTRAGNQGAMAGEDCRGVVGVRADPEGEVVHARQLSESRPPARAQARVESSRRGVNTTVRRCKITAW